MSLGDAVEKNVGVAVNRRSLLGYRPCLGLHEECTGGAEADDKAGLPSPPVLFG